MIYRFGNCELDSARHELRRDGDLQVLEPQVLSVLLLLLETSVDAHGLTGVVLWGIASYGTCWVIGFAAHDGTLSRVSVPVSLIVGVGLLAFGLFWGLTNPDPDDPTILGDALGETLFSIGFVVLFTIGGFSGLMLAITPVDFQYHDTYFVVAHFHYVLVTGAVYSIMGAAYYWLPKWTGNMYDEKLGKIHFWVSTISVNVLFFPQHFLGLAGMPRRIPDYSTQFADFNWMASVGAIGFGLSQLVFVYVLLTAKKGEKATNRVWEEPRGLEWTVPSPAPYHTFATPPKLRVAQESFE